MTAPCPNLGFVVTFELVSSADQVAREQLADAWLAMLKSRSLCSSGGGEARLTYAVSSDAAQATNDDREAVKEWLASRAELSVWRVGEIEDLEQAV